MNPGNSSVEGKGKGDAGRKTARKRCVPSQSLLWAHGAQGPRNSERPQTTGLTQQSRERKLGSSPTNSLPSWEGLLLGT